MIKAIVFDMDGVLIDAREWHYEALNRALRLFGMEISLFDHVTTFDGLPTKRKLEILSATRGLPVSLHPFINDMKQQYTTEIIQTRCKPTFGQEYALSRLRLAGYRLAVASNSVRSTVELMMAKAELDGYFDLMISNQDVRAHKPDPEMYELAIAKLGVLPRETLIVEDNENGIKAATASGAHVKEVAGVEDVTLRSLVATIERCEREA
jgi:HAD superfamily hydrolase (TIGR01509 family)